MAITSFKLVNLIRAGIIVDWINKKIKQIFSGGSHESKSQEQASGRRATPGVWLASGSSEGGREGGKEMM